MLAVTTRNKLKSMRFMLPMLAARKRVRGQLRRIVGLIRWADAIASPTEFYTLTCWANQHLMFEFMSSDAHRELMWLFTKWSDEFWSMRWSPSACEVGEWNGMRLARRSDNVEHRPQSPIPDIAPGPRAGPVDPSTCPVIAVMARVTARSTAALWSLLRARRRMAHVPNVVRWAMGSVVANQYLLITLWRNYDDRVLTSLTTDLRAEWVMAWRPGDYEIGHWDGLRLRQLASAARRGQAQLADVALAKT